jgi:adenylate cyclase
MTQNGLSIMGIWGAPESSGSSAQDARNCIESALMIRETVCRLNTNSKAVIKIGCGINSGEVVAGQFGSEDRIEYSIIGDVVNTAARFEAATDLFDADILMTEGTRSLLGDEFMVEELSLIEVKGKEKPQRVFSLMNTTPDSKILVGGGGGIA